MSIPIYESTRRKISEAQTPVFVPPVTLEDRVTFWKNEVAKEARAKKYYEDELALTAPRSASKILYLKRSIKHYDECWRYAAKKLNGYLLELEAEKTQRIIDGVCNTQDEITPDEALGNATA